jgi:hypothetical protein
VKIPDKKRIKYNSESRKEESSFQFHPFLPPCLHYQLSAPLTQTDFPNTKAMLPPGKRNGIKELYLTTNTSSMKVSD